MIHSFYPLISEVTKKLYITEKGYCRMYELPTDAQTIAGTIKNVSVGNEKQMVRRDFANYYAMGVKGITILLRDGKEQSIDISPDELPRDSYNPEANRAIVLLLETKKKKYLRDLCKCELYAPAIVDKRQPKQYPSVNYCTAMAGTQSLGYVLFSTITEFNKWKQMNDDPWLPLRTGLSKFGQIRKNSDIIINPQSDKLWLSDSQLNDVTGIRRKDGKSKVMAR